MTDLFEAVYADGWDGRLVNPLSRAEAEARDAAGTPYAVLLLAAGRPHTLFELSWGDGYCGTVRFDARGRRIASHEWRRTGAGDLFLRRRRTWDGPDDVGDVEFAHVAARRTTTYRLDGRCVEIDEPRGDRGGRTDRFGAETPPRLPRPGFGRWPDLLGLGGERPVPVVDAAAHSLPVVTADAPPWQPPRPATPGDVAALFADGAERAGLGGRRRARLDVRRVGELRLPSGRLVAADPSSLDHDADPFLVTVPPGSYPVTLSRAIFPDEPGHIRVAAARLDVTDRPVRSWELALCPGQDPLDLGHDEFFGFGVDAGLACFVDADERDRLADVWKSVDMGVVDEGHLLVDGDAMVLWTSGWGDGVYPTWIGRDSDGGVVCFLADMQL